MVSQDLSANTLEQVRKNITVTSFMIIVYFFLGGQQPEIGTVVKLPFTNIDFTHPERIIWIVWMMLAWWIYRYYSLGAWGECTSVFYGEELKGSSYNWFSRRLIEKYTVDAEILPESFLDKYVLSHQLIVRISCPEGQAELKAIEGNEDMVIDNSIGRISESWVVDLLLLNAIVTQASILTFFLPLFVTTIALGASIGSAFNQTFEISLFLTAIVAIILLVPWSIFTSKRRKQRGY